MNRLFPSHESRASWAEEARWKTPAQRVAELQHGDPVTMDCQIIKAIHDAQKEAFALAARFVSEIEQANFFSDPHNAHQLADWIGDLSEDIQGMNDIPDFMLNEPENESDD
jgi:hypothetical protein